MTTIAYKNGIVAYDSRFVCGDTIEDDDADKKVERDGKIFFIAGNCSDYEFLVDSYIQDKAVRDKINARAIVIDDGKLYTTSVSEDDGFWRCIERLDNPIAIGSGKSFALAFMDAGMSAEDAVRATCKRDLYSGGIVRTFKIDR